MYPFVRLGKRRLIVPHVAFAVAHDGHHDYNVSMRRQSVSVAEAKRSLSELLSRVAYRGESIVIAKRGKPVARLVPVTSSSHRSLADVRGWLADDDPFFAAMDEISRIRHARRPRSAPSSRRQR